MAALFLHNSLFSPTSDPEHTPTSATSMLQGPPPPSSPRPREPAPLQHARQASTTTFHSNTSRYSHTNETSHRDSLADSSTAHHSLFSKTPRRAPRTASGTDVTSSTAAEATRSADRSARRKRRRRLKMLRGVLELVISSWAIYNIVRYFIAATIYTSHDRQIINLTLGSVSSLSLALLLVSLILRHVFPSAAGSFSTMLSETVFPYLSAFCLLAPAIVNFILVFLWRHASDPSTTLAGRCKWDIDVSWTGTGSKCSGHPITWGVFLAAAIVRVILTFGILELYHLTTYLYAVGPRPRTSDRSYRRYSLSMPFLSSLSFGSRPNSQSTPTDPSPGSSNLIRSLASTPISFGLGRTRQPASPPQPEPQSPYSPPSLQRRGSSHSYIGHASSQGHLGLASVPENTQLDTSPHVRGSMPSGEDAPREDIQEQRRGLLETMPPTPGSAYSDRSGPEATPALTEAQLQALAAQFRALVAQVSRETDAGMLSSPGSTPGSVGSTPSPGDRPGDSYFPAIASVEASGFRLASGEYVSYDEFGITPPEDRVRVLNTYIRRMPTIESMGSREAPRRAGSVTTSGYSRPPTRMTTMSTPVTDSLPPSRSNSLSLRHMLQGPEQGSSGSEPRVKRSRSTTERHAPSHSGGSGNSGTGSASASGSGSGSGGGSVRRQRSASLGSLPSPSPQRSFTSYYTASPSSSPLQSPVELAHGRGAGTPPIP